MSCWTSTSSEDKIEIPFEHPDIRALIDSMFLDGTLHPLLVQKVPADVPDWLAVGIVRDPAARRNLVRDGLKRLLDTMPSEDGSHRDWLSFAKRFGEILSRFHALDQAHAQGLDDLLQEVQQRSDELLLSWIAKHYSDLPSLPAAAAPTMLHQVPRFLAMRRGTAGKKVALLVFDGLAMDQWVQIREHVTGCAPQLVFDEGACFAWLPTLTAVSRQALFSGLKPREFADSIAGTSAEPSFWSRFWQDHGLRTSEILYRKGIRRVDQLDELAEPALPPDFLPLFTGGRTAFVNKGEPLVAHGGISVEELIVPFVSVGARSWATDPPSA